MIGYLIYLISVLLVLQTPKVIASTNDWSITTEQYNAIVKTFPEQDQLRYISVEYRRGLVNELVRIWVLCTEARKNGIEVGTDYQSQKNYYEKVAQDIGNTITDEAVRAYYATHTEDFTSLSVSHILIL